MTTRSVAVHSLQSSALGTWLRTSLVLVGACAASLAVALLNRPYFDLVNGVANLQGAESRGLLFSSWLMLIALPIVARRPAAFGFTLGSMHEHSLLMALVIVGGGMVTTGILLALGPTPYSEASWFIETVDVPITEELVFRGVLLTGLVAVLLPMHRPRIAIVLAVIFNGLAFGIAHLANATDLALAFAVMQAGFAALLGMACAGLMVRTGSVYPAILLHAVVNGVVVAL